MITGILLVIFVAPFIWRFLHGKLSEGDLVPASMLAALGCLVFGFFVAVTASNLVRVEDQIVTQLVYKDTLANGLPNYVYPGGTDDDPAIIYYYQDKDTTIEAAVEASASKHVEDAQPGQASVVDTFSHCRSGWWDWFILCNNQTHSYVFHVPPGTWSN